MSQFHNASAASSVDGSGWWNGHPQNFGPAIQHQQASSSQPHPPRYGKENFHAGHHQSQAEYVQVQEFRSMKPPLMPYNFNQGNVQQTAGVAGSAGYVPELASAPPARFTIGVPAGQAWHIDEGGHAVFPSVPPGFHANIDYVQNEMHTSYADVIHRQRDDLSFPHSSSAHSFPSPHLSNDHRSTGFDSSTVAPATNLNSRNHILPDMGSNEGWVDSNRFLPRQSVSGTRNGLKATVSPASSGPPSSGPAPSSAERSRWRTPSVPSAIRLNSGSRGGTGNVDPFRSIANNSEYDNVRTEVGTLTPTPDTIRNRIIATSQPDLSAIEDTHQKLVNSAIVPDRARSITPTQARVAEATCKSCMADNTVSAEMSSSAVSGSSRQRSFDNSFSEAEQRLILHYRDSKARTSTFKQEGADCDSRFRSQHLNGDAPVFVPEHGCHSASGQPEYVPAQLNDRSWPFVHRLMNEIFSPLDFRLYKPTSFELARPEHELKDLPPPNMLPFVCSANINRTVKGCINWLEYQQYMPEAMVYFCHFMIRTMSTEPVLFDSEKILHYSTLIVDLQRNFFHSCPHLVYLFRFHLARASESVLRRIYLNVQVDSQNYRRYHYLDSFPVGSVQACILGMLFKIDFIPFSKLISLAWFLLEHAPHRAAVEAIYTLIAVSGETVYHPHNVRDLGDFMMALGRKYVLPPLGGRFPDVFFVGMEEREKQYVFDSVRTLIKKLQNTIYKGRIQAAKQSVVEGV